MLYNTITADYISNNIVTTFIYNVVRNHDIYSILATRSTRADILTLYLA